MPSYLLFVGFVLFVAVKDVRCKNKTNNYIEKPSFPSINDQDFKAVRLRVSDGLYVDKSLLIEEILRSEEDRLFLITRPHKFGKTLNLNMVKRFFELNWDNKADCENNRELFVGGEVKGALKPRTLSALAIAQNADVINGYQGKFPVVSFTFSDISGRNHEDMENCLRDRLFDLYHVEFGSLLRKLAKPEDTVLDEADKEKLRNYLNRNIDYATMLDGLLFLTKVLRIYFKQRVIVLIDDYDFAVNEAFAMHGGKSREFKFIHDTTITFLSRALKHNANVKRALIAGILPLSKGDNAGLNTVSGFTVLDRKFSKYFGFTPEEVQDLLYLAPIDTTGDEIKEWYNGYSFGGHPLYSPVSVMECLRHRGALKNYRLKPSSLEILDEITASSVNVAKLQELLQNEHVLANIHSAFLYAGTADELDIFSYLLFKGYLKAVRVDPKQDLYEISIPNYESKNVLTNRITRWIESKLDIDSNKVYKTLYDSLSKGNVDDFKNTLEYILSRAHLKHLYAGAEVHYAALLAGLISRNVGDDCSVRFNQLLFLEGRVDIALVPHSVSKPMAIIMVVKMSERDSPCLLKRTATLALQDIYDHFNDTKVKSGGHVEYVLKMGIGYSKKSIEIKYQLEKRVANERNKIKWIKVASVQSTESIETRDGINLPKHIIVTSQPSLDNPPAVVPVAVKDFTSFLETNLPLKNLDAFNQLEAFLEKSRDNRINFIYFLKSQPKGESFGKTFKNLLSAVLSKELTPHIAYMVKSEDKIAKFHDSRAETALIDVVRELYPDLKFGEVLEQLRKTFENIRKRIYVDNLNKNKTTTAAPASGPVTSPLVSSKASTAAKI